MSSAKKRSEQHLIDQEGEKLFRDSLPRHWVIREYRPDYGLDFTIELFREGNKADRFTTYETLGEHVFIQLKSVSSPEIRDLKIFGRNNVEKSPETLDKSEHISTTRTIPFQLEISELVTIERMSTGIPVLLVIADLKTKKCSFVCINDYIDKILIPRFDNYRDADSRQIHVPARNQLGTEHGLIATRWYAKRPKLTAAFQRFTYQYSELCHAKDDNWRHLAEYFAQKISAYDFWDDTEMCPQIGLLGQALQTFIETGQPKLIAAQPQSTAVHNQAYLEQCDVYELWRQLANLPKLNEDIWREWFLPTALGELTSNPTD